MTFIAFHWDVHFSRLVQDWGLEPLVAFLDLIYSKPIRGEGMDRPCWRLAKSRDFDVCSYYHSLSAPNSMSFLWILLWWSKVPPKVAFFSWAGSLGKI